MTDKPIKVSIDCRNKNFSIPIIIVPKYFRQYEFERLGERDILKCNYKKIDNFDKGYVFKTITLEYGKKNKIRKVILYEDLDIKLTDGRIISIVIDDKFLKKHNIKL